MAENDIKKLKKVNLRIVIITGIIALGTVTSCCQCAAEGFNGAKIFTIFGLCFGLLAACFFGIGLWMSKEEIKKSTETVCGGNPTAMAVLMMNRKDAKFGFVFLFLGFFLQFIGAILT